MVMVCFQKLMKENISEQFTELGLFGMKEITGIQRYRTFANRRGKGLKPLVASGFIEQEVETPCCIRVY
jgi:hypothetical protein